MRDEFSTLDIVKALKIPRERLRDWMNQGFVKPTIPAEGQGTKAVFTRTDVYLLALFRHLVNSGFKRDMAAFILKHELKRVHLPYYKTLHFIVCSKGGKKYTRSYWDVHYDLMNLEDLSPEFREKEELIEKLRLEHEKSGDKEILKKINSIGSELNDK